MTFAAGFAAWLGGDAENSAPAAYSGALVATASMITIMSSCYGLATLPRRVEIALRIAHDLVIYAEAGHCDVVEQRRHEVEELDNLVYEVVLMDDPRVSKCYESSSSPSSSPPAAPALPARESTSTVR